MAAERAPGENRLKRESTSIGTEISALGTLKGALSSFQGTLATLKTVEVFSARTATSSDDKIFTATATSGAATSAYNIRVNALAKAHQIASDPFVAGADSVVGTGTLKISMGTAEFSVSIDSSHSKLSQIRDAINSASDNPGVKAAIVNASDGAHLVLTSSTTGVANRIKVTTTSTDGLEKLAYDFAGDTSNYDQVVAAQDSSITIAGRYTKTSSSNNVTDAIDGVNLTLKKESDVGVDTLLTVEANKATVATRIKNFVSQYNAAYSQLNDLGKYDAQTQKAGPLLGDPLLRSVVGEMRRGIGDAVPGLSGEYTSLASIGITTARDGKLQIDEAKLDKALTSSFDAVGKIFGSTDGVAARMDKLIAKRLDATAELASRNATLDKRSKSITKRSQELEVYLAKVEETYRRQFNALDTAMAKMQSTSSFLSSQLANLPKIG